MDRRFFLKAAGAVVASAYVITRSTPGEAMPAAPGHLPSTDPDGIPAVATDADIENVRPEQARWVWVRPRRRWRRRYWRRYYWRPRRWRRRYWRRRWYY